MAKKAYERHLSYIYNMSFNSVQQCIRLFHHPADFKQGE